MCVTSLARVVDVDAAGALVTMAGTRRRAGTRLYPDVQVGEWVLVGAGTILQRLSPDEAEIMAAGAVAVEGADRVHA